MACNCEENKRFEDIEHVAILATQCANTLKCDYGIYKQGKVYKFHPLYINSRKANFNFIREIRFNRESTDNKISQVKRKRKLKSINKDEQEAEE